MSKFVIETTLTRRTLMNKSRWQLCDVIDLYIDQNGQLQKAIRKAIAALSGDAPNVEQALEALRGVEE